MDTDPKQDLKIDLPGSLVLRRANQGDIESLLAINGQLLGQDSYIEVKYLITGDVPGVRLEDFLVVVEPTGRVVSSLALIEQELRVGQTRLKIGNPEFVSTLPEYRGAGLVRQQFAVLDKWHKERGLALSLIIGIRYFYRLFGYEYGLEDFRAGFLYPTVHTEKLAAFPDLEVRKIVESDAPVLAAMYAETAAQVDIALTFPDTGFAWAARHRELQANHFEDWVAVRNGQPVALARLHLNDNTLAVNRFAGELEGQQAIIKKSLAWPGLEKLGISTVRGNSLSQWVASLNPGRWPSHANYVRIVDPVLAFQQLAPEFERRLAESNFAGLNQEIELGFYRFGLALTFADGKLVKVDARPGRQDPGIGIPPDLLQKILMGFRSLDELVEVYPDLIIPKDADWELVQTLFPPLKSMVNFFI